MSNFDDVGDIIKRRNDFISQVNHILCYFKNLNSFVKYKLFSSCCLSKCGYELWLLTATVFATLRFRGVKVCEKYGM